MKTKRIILAGGAGVLGRILAKSLAADNWEVVVLTRSPQTPPGPARHVLWDGTTPGAWITELEGADTIVNLSGRSVDCRYHAANRRLILDSRVNSTTVIGQTIAQCKTPPRVWLNASTATIYKHSFERAMDENGEIGGTREAKDEFSVEVAQAWERAFDQAPPSPARKVKMRMAMVFSTSEHTVFPVLRRLVRLGLGGSLAGGNQFVSWMHEEDFCRAVKLLIADNRFTGPVNLVSPNPLPNREMMRTLRKVCGAPFGLPAALWMLEVGAFVLRTETELIIKSRRVVPARLLSAGFQFNYPRFENAVREIESRVRNPEEK